MMANILYQIAAMPIYLPYPAGRGWGWGSEATAERPSRPKHIPTQPLPEGGGVS